MALPSSSPDETTTNIDLLLESYLHLLSTYTSLRTQLSLSQSTIHQSLARAAFSSPHTTPLDILLFDERARDAVRGVRIDPAPASDGGHGGSGDDGSGVPVMHIEERTTITGRFGVPPALRDARDQAVEMVGLVPRIVGCEREMRELERRIGRARKVRAKVEKGKGKGEE